MRNSATLAILALSALVSAGPLRLSNSHADELTEYKYSIERELYDSACNAFHDLCTLNCKESTQENRCQGPIDDKFSLSCVCVNRTLDLTDFIYNHLPNPLLDIEPFYYRPTPENYCEDFLEVCTSFCTSGNSTDSTNRITCEAIPEGGDVVNAECFCGGEDVSSFVSELIGDTDAVERFDRDDEGMYYFDADENDDYPEFAIDE